MHMDFKYKLQIFKEIFSLHLASLGYTLILVGPRWCSREGVEYIRPVAGV